MQYLHRLSTDSPVAIVAVRLCLNLPKQSPCPLRQMMDLPCYCNDSGKHIFRTMASFAGNKSAPLDEVLQLHQNIHLLGRGIRDCLVCCTNDDIMAALLDGLATLSTLYEAARIKYSEASAPGDATPKSVPTAMPSVVLGRIELTDSETNLVAVTLIKQGLSQTGSHLRDLQQHLTKCLTAKKMERSNYDVYKRRVGEILNGIYSSLAGI